MADVEGWKWTVGVVVTVLGLYLTWRGARYTADRAAQGVDRAADVNEQASALGAWKELVQPYRDEVSVLRRELAEERDARIARERADELARAAAKEQVDQQMQRMTERIDLLTIQLHEWKRLAKTIARWAGRLRDEVLRLGGTVPATPEELLTLQAIEDAEGEK